ncbi:MAG: Si-specific NAD(P)(+) transhydrogenase [Planctomycetes bacterium]|nr:Si-specific NAD(P)(+) transhydrogenase [Planctomycetota bacterium]
MARPYDLIVIGSGPAGEKGAAQAAYFGKKVAVVERSSYVGGTGVNTGTVPSKTLRETALYFSGMKQRGLYGIDYSLKKDLTVASFLHREKQVVAALRQKVAHNVHRHNIQLVWGSASFLEPHVVRVIADDGSTRDLEGEFFLIATGSSPFHPPGLDFSPEDIYDSDELLSMDYIPKSMAVLGAGVIGCEYASIFQALDVKVTLVDGRDRMLPWMDHEVVDRLRARFEEMGMTVLFNDRVEKAVCTNPGVVLHMSSGRRIVADKALFAAGRQSNVGGLRLPEIGVALGERGVIRVDEHYRTSVANVYAAGDVIGFPALASTAMEQARVAVCHAFDFAYKTRVSPVLPFAVYTIPEFSMVGKTEEDLKKEGTPYLVGRCPYAGVDRGQILGELSGLVKLIFHPEDKRLLGAHILGESASELIHLGAACLQVGGTIDHFIDAVYNYPSISEAYKYAAYDGLGMKQRWETTRRERRAPGAAEAGGAGGAGGAASGS